MTVRTVEETHYGGKQPRITPAEAQDGANDPRPLPENAEEREKYPLVLTMTSQLHYQITKLLYQRGRIKSLMKAGTVATEIIEALDLPKSATCINCGELVPQGCCTCGPERVLKAVIPEHLLPEWLALERRI